MSYACALCVTPAQGKVLLLRGVVHALRAQHAQRTVQLTGGQPRETAPTRAVSPASHPPVSEEVEDDELGQEGRSQPGQLGEKGRSQEQELQAAAEITSWADDECHATAQLLRVVRARVLRLCAASLPASAVAAAAGTDQPSAPPTSASTPAPASPAPAASAAASDSPALVASSPPASAPASPSAAIAQTSAVLLPQLPTVSRVVASSPPSSAPASASASAATAQTLAAGGVVGVPATQEASYMVALLRDMLELDVPWTVAQG